VNLKLDPETMTRFTDSDSPSRPRRILFSSGVDSSVNILSRRTFLLGSGIAFASYLLYEVNALKVVHYTVSVRNLPPSFRNFTILHLSDLHQKRFGKSQSRLLATIKRHQYDIITLTGDLINRLRPQVEPTLELVAGLRPKPMFFVNGNNEWGAALRYGYRITTHLAAAGVTVLNNEAVPLRRNDRHIWIAGVDDSINGKANLPLTLSQTTDGAPIILLSHSSSPFMKSSKAGVDLLLTGHTHGGQIRIPFLGALWTPEAGLFPRWDYGLFREGDTTMIVNGGLGESIIPIRFNIPPEIILVTLTPLKGNRAA
jgi:uncharacterized protein